MRIFTKLKTMKLKVLVLAAIVFGVYMFISSILLHVWFTTDNEFTNPIVLPYVVVHLDLKGTPLKLSYLESLLPKMREFGANSLLMEYEDMFPYEGRLENLSAESCYTKNELIKFLTVAKKSGFEIIPLVQTFGHMEHVLKLDEFRDLREDHRHPDSICPSRQESNALVMEMLEQVIQLHTAVAPLKHIHIGCDEVYHLNKCQYCVQRNMTKLDIFVDHVRTVSGFVKSLSPNTAVLIWDDMLQDIKPHIWNKIGPLDVQPVYWEYAPKLRVTHYNLMQYHNKFRHIWIASAFKGADGRTSTFPILNNRFTNVFNWMKFIQDYKFGGESKVYNFQGMILTGWSRYTHMDPPCELLPVAYPSLIMTLLLIQKFKNGEISSSWKSKHSDPFQAFREKYLVNLSMDCTTHSNVYNENGCKFDGQVLYTTIALIQHRELLKHYDANSNKFENFEYYSKLGLINTNQVLNNIASISLRLESLLRTEKLIIRQMNKYYKKDFIAEYVHYKTYYLKNKLQSALNALLSYSEKQSWSRRSKNISFYI